MVKSKKKKRPVTKKNNDEEVDFETLVREEFKKLQRQYRLMEDARHAIAGESGKLSKQGRILERLREEKDDLLTDLRNATCKAYKKRDKMAIKTILEALERYEKYKEDISTCLLKISEMESNVDRITQKLVEQKLKVQALYGQSMTVPQADHRKRVLENRLYHVTTQFDTLVSQNRELKQAINMMLKLRGSFYRRMIAIKELSAKIKQRMGEVVLEATAAYDQRDEWVNKINMLRERNDKESKQHVLEIKEFQRVLHHDSKIHEFLAIKNRDRGQLESAKQINERKIQAKFAELDALLEAYKKSFNIILKMAKTRDIETLVKRYLSEEQKNFAVFKYIADLNQETNSLQEEISQMKVQIEQLAKESKQRNKEQQEILKALDQELDEETKKLEESLTKFNEADQAFEVFGDLLYETFKAAGCNEDLIKDSISGQEGIGSHNFNLLMGIFEHRVTELLFEKGYLEVRKIVEVDGNPLPKKPQLWQPGAKPNPQGGPFRPQMHVTGRVDAEQDEEDNETKAWSERPIYYGEMLKQLQFAQSGKPSIDAGEGGGVSGAPSSLELDAMSKQSIVPKEGGGGRQDKGHHAQFVEEEVGEHEDEGGEEEEEAQAEEGS